MVLGAMYLCAVLMYVIGERTMSGSRWRIFTAILVYACGAVLPMMYNRETEIVPMGVCGLVTMWLLGFKAMGWAVGRGPLAEDLSHGKFAAVAILPITPVTQRTEMKQGRWAGRARQVRGWWEGGNAEGDRILSRIKFATVVSSISRISCLKQHTMTIVIILNVKWP